MLRRNIVRDYKAASRNFFDKLAPQYDRHYYGTHGRQQYQRVVDVARSWKFASVLDVGCGTGSLLASLRRPRLKLAGADLSPVMMTEAKKRLGKTADLRVADSENLPWKAGTFDLVVTTDSIHHWPNPTKAFSEIKRVLKKGGHVVIADVYAPAPLRQLGNWIARFGKEGDVKVYSEAEFERMLSDAGFADIRRDHLSFMAIVIHAKVEK
jgi:ubiquinone/menaquinone biosynthesis C-methylase UbiE